MGIKWNDERIKAELLKCIKVLQIDRMPTASELKDIGRNDLHCAISRSKKYSGWAKELGLSLKQSETTKGQKYEKYVRDVIKTFGYDVKQMTTKHPFDLLINDTVKVDVKVGGVHNHFGARCHTFRPSKKYATCDIYVCIGLDEKGKVEKRFVIPSKYAKLVTINICNDSKYNVFLERWDYIERFVKFYQAI
jgi:hypothetical protein